MREAVSSMDSNPILKLMFDPEEYALVARRLAVLEDGHPEVDIVYPLTRLLSKWQDDGIIVQQDTTLLANVIKCVFLLTTHRDEIREEVYPAAMDFFIDMITDIVPLALIFGKFASCKYVCWQAPFMIIGKRIRDRFGLYGLRIRADAASCKHCNACTRNCPMSIDVMKLAQQGEIASDECILCGNCVDAC